MKIMSVVGARPNFMKVAPIIKAIQNYNDRLLCRRDGTVAGEGPIQMSTWGLAPDRTLHRLPRL
jgi:hypothetical protein